MALDPHGDDEASKRFVTMVPGERISKIALRQIDQGGQRGDSFHDKLKFAAENGSLTARDERIANKRLQTIEKLEEAGEDTPAQIIQQGLAATGYPLLTPGLGIVRRRPQRHRARRSLGRTETASRWPTLRGG